MGFSPAGCGPRGPRQEPPHRLELDSVEHVLEEAAQDQALRVGPREAAGHRVEELVSVDLADGRAVRAADVVRLDLEARDESACAFGDKRRLRFSWYAFVFCASGSTRIIPRQTAVASSRSAPLNAKSDVVFGAWCSWSVS